MDDIEYAAQLVADQAWRLSTFAGISRHGPGDRFFLVMGMTGSGKSTFISRCTRKPVNISCGLYSCTDSIDVFEFSLDGRRIHLIDTPGFNDTNRSDIDTLGILATWLSASYANGVRIHGLVMLHSISDNRMSGSSMRNLAMIKAICGFASYTNVVIATTMWPGAPDHTEITALQAREAELLSEDKFFGSLIARGAVVFRHNEEADNDFYREATSAKHIVNHLVQQAEIYAPGVLQLQREIVDQGKTLGETAAGIAAAGELYKEQKAHKHQLRKLRVEINGQLDESNAAYVTQLRELEADAEKKLKKAEDDGQALKHRMKDLHVNEHNSLREKMEEMDMWFCREISVREEELREMEESLGELRKDLARRSQEPRAEHEESIKEARKQVAQVRKVYQNFSGQFDDILKSYDLKNNVINGGVNGLVAGVTSGVIAAVASGLMCTIM